MCEIFYLYETSIDVRRKTHGEYKIFKNVLEDIYIIVPMKNYDFRELKEFIYIDYINFIIRFNNKIKNHVS